MRQTRIYLDQPLAAGATLLLDRDASQHLARVLRLPVGAPLRVFNGRGAEHVARLITSDARGSQVQVGEAVSGPPPSTLRITLAQALVVGERMDLVIRKAVELGVHAIVPITSERCTVRLQGQRGERRAAHWRAIMISACEQCGRNDLPGLAELQELGAWAASQSTSRAVRLALAPGGDRRIRDVSPGDHELVLVVGPEGGLSQRDLQQLHQAGFERLGLGPRILRTETAGLAAIAALQARLGDM